MLVPCRLSDKKYAFVAYKKNRRTMKYYLIAGEASGDLHASNLMRALKAYDAEAEFRFFLAVT